MIKNNKFYINEFISLVDFLTSKKFNIKKIKKMVLTNQILVNNNIVNFLNYELKKGDLLELVNNDLSLNIDNKKIYEKIKVIYEDNYFFIFFKPSGLLTVKSYFNEDITFYDYLLDKYKYLKNVERSGIVHRLDKCTAGLIIVAKSNEIYNIFLDMFKNNKVIKKYYALVQNNFKDFKKYLINYPIGYKNNSDLRFTTINPKNPKEAITYFKPIKNLKDNLSLIDVELVTGRTHQIRVHMSAINHPIYNDPLYSKNCTSNYEQFLYSYSLKFNHPITYVLIDISIDFDDIFENKLISLGYYE